MNLVQLINKAELYLSTRVPPRKKYKNFKLRKFSNTNYNPDLERLSKCLVPLKKLNSINEKFLI